MSANGESDEGSVGNLSPENVQDRPSQENIAKEDSSVPRRVYLLYLGLTALLFVFLIIVGTLALNQGWLPSR